MITDNIFKSRQLEQDEETFILSLYHYHPAYFFGFTYLDVDYFSIKTRPNRWTNSIIICEKFKSKKLIDITLDFASTDQDKIAVGTCFTNNKDHEKLMNELVEEIKKRYYEFSGLNKRPVEVVYG